jgi:small subunit ribosomal protein S5
MAGNRRKNTRSKEKESEWQERVVQIRRVTKVVKGGKKLSFRAIVVVGNERGQVGVGVGKAGDVIGAVKKGVADGKKHLVDVPLTRSYSLPQQATGYGGGAKVFMRPAAPWYRGNRGGCCADSFRARWRAQRFGETVGVQ